ncbi:hypothetical protein RND81_12G207600 [Saponaria officinalis]|uniref:Pentatricopeptide repeat-containing protein n=1 Tax=Saponaria officinalis TaxID=3572 RepID=A0AAW1HDA1_SAPOF
MSIPSLLLLKQCLTKPIFQTIPNLTKQPAKPQLNLPRRTFSFNAATSNFYSEIVDFITNSPNESFVPLLEKHFVEDKAVLQDELVTVVRKLRKHKRFDRALEIYEWASQKSLNRADFGDPAVHLDLIGKARGVEAAEKFFYETNNHSEKDYRSMLNCYVQEQLVDKALSLFQKMKELGIASSSLTYNSIMSLYLKTEEPKKILDLLLEMQDSGVSPDDVGHRMCLKACALTSDYNSLDKILKATENQPHPSLDWFMYSAVANYYIDGGYPEKARNCLQKAELGLHNNPIGYNNLISTYTKLGDVSDVTRLWQKRKDVCGTPINNDYRIMLDALVKLDKFEQAEKLLEEWESSGNDHDSRVPEVLLMGYALKGQVEEAERMLESMISKYPTISPTSWVIISKGHIKRENMQKAVQCMEKALQLGLQHKGWVPKHAVVWNILTWLGDHGDVEVVYEFLKLMSRVVPMNRNMYQALLSSSKRYGKDIDDFVQRMKADNIDVDEETLTIMRGTCEI